MSEEKAIVHYVSAGLGRSFYTTICGLSDDSLWMTMNKSAVSCSECLEALKIKKK